MAEKNLTFIHLADIHFTKFSGDGYDLDNDLRKEILRDIKDNAKTTVDKPDGILVCGDIAFSGSAAEYNAAGNFLYEICKVLDIPETSVFCVPGNHDVDQNIPKNSKGFVDMQSMIENTPDLDGTLAAYLRDPMYNSSLFRHIHEYNTFASRFSCNIDATKYNWKSNFLLNDTSTLSIVGINSIVISNHCDYEHRLMVLGGHQIPEREAGVVYASLCHHPSDCWKDSDEMKDKFNERVCIQLYGHKHIQKIKQVNNSLIIGSGATHPCRSEQKWRPRYNWLSLHVDGISNNRQLKISIYPRILDDNDSTFMPDTNNCNGNNFIEYSLKLEKWEANKVKPSEKINTSKENLIDTTSKDINQKTILNPYRTLVYRFLELSFVTRSVILTELSLVSDEDDGIEHIKLIDKILKRAKEKNILAKFWDEVQKAHDDRQYTTNPFTNDNS